MTLQYHYKEAGVTSADMAQELKRKLDISKICFCGRLDPMARGVMAFLVNEHCRQMNSFLHHDKTYQFEIICGISTDTDDVMGLITDTLPLPNSILKIARLIDHLYKLKISAPYTYSQAFHRLSSKTVKTSTNVRAEPLWRHFQNGTPISDSNMPTKERTVKELDIIDSQVRNFKEWRDHFSQIIDGISRRHNFRQDRIIENWNKPILNDLNHVFSIKCQMTVSSGFFIRQFVNELSIEVGLPMLAYDINRIRLE